MEMDLVTIKIINKCEKLHYLACYMNRFEIARNFDSC